MNVAILGASSHIAKGLIYNFSKLDKCNLCLFSTREYTVLNFITKNILKNDKCRISVDDYSTDLSLYNLDIIINCVGVGSTNKLNGKYENYFTFPEYYDNLCINYLKEHEKCIYFSFSSGAVYGTLQEQANLNTKNCIEVNNVKSTNYYSITRLYTEAKHRAFKDLNIVDLRIFSYFSRFIDFKDKYFITELIRHILEDKEFIVMDDTFIRDYLHPDDLYQMIIKCFEIGRINNAFDATSRNPISKIEILNYFKSRYGLKCKFDNTFEYKSSSGIKGVYCSSLKNNIGYNPEYSSMGTLMNESKYLLKEKK